MLIFDSAKRRNLYSRIMTSADFSNNNGDTNKGIPRLNPLLENHHSWNKYFLPIIANKTQLEEIQDRDTICFLISEIDKILKSSPIHYIQAQLEQPNNTNSLSEHFRNRNIKQEKRLRNQVVRYLKRLKKDFQRNLQNT